MLAFLVLPHIATALGNLQPVPQPAPAVWKAYDPLSHVLQVQWPAVSGTYQVTYTAAGTNYPMPVSSNAYESIPCASTDGSTLEVQYTLTVGSEISIPSPAVTFMCAALPRDLPSVTLTQLLSQVTVAWPAADEQGIGTAVLFYNLYKHATAWALLAQIPPTTLSYTDSAVQYGVQYQYKVSVLNWVGESLTPPSASVTPVRQTDPAQSTMIRPISVQTMNVYSIVVTAKDSAGVLIPAPTELLYMVVMDFCKVPAGNFLCIRVSSTDPNYVSDFIGPSNVYTKMTNHNDGTYSASYTPLLRGPYSFAVELYRPSGLWGEVWDNIWLTGVPDKAMVVGDLDQEWGVLDLIATYAGDFVSLRLTGLLLSPVSEEVTFYLYGDDGIRLYWGGVVVLDKWDVCCTETTYVATLTQGSYYPIRIEWKQLQAAASFSVKWESYSLSKATIPSQYLLYPRYVADSPWLVTVTSGLSSAELSYATGLDTATAGVLKTIFIYSVDARGNLVDNPTDSFSLVFTLGTVELAFASTYVSNGQSIANVRLTASGLYSVTITLYRVAIKGNPYSITVSAGAENAATSSSSLASFLSSNNPVTCGLFYTLSFSRVDAFLNPVTTGLVDMTLVYQDSGVYVSPIGVTYPSDWKFTYGTDYQGTVANDGISLRFTVYHAGNYLATVRLNGIALGQGTLPLAAKPNAIFPERCIAVLTSSATIAGTGYTFKVQLRDEYYNFSRDTLTSLSSAVCTAVAGTTVVQGSFQDSDPGVLLVTLPLNVVGQYAVTVSLNSITVLNSGFQVAVRVSALSASKSTLSTLALSVLAGTQIVATISARDDYSNLRAGVIDSFTVTVTGAGKGGSLPTTESNNSDGTYSVRFQPTVVDVYTVVCTTAGTDITGSGQSFSVTAGMVAGPKSIIQVLPTYTVGKGFLTISSFDAYNNPVEVPVNSALMGSGVYYGLFAGPASYMVPATFTAFTNYEIPLNTVTKTGTYSFLLGLRQQGGLQAFYYEARDFTGLLALHNAHNFPNTEPQFYTTVDPTISFNWAYDAPSWLQTADYFSAKWSGFVRAINTEVLTLVVTADELVRVTWDGVVVIDSLTTKVMTLKQSAQVAVVRNQYYPILIEYLEDTGTAVLMLQWQSNSLALATIPSAQLFSLLYSESGPFALSLTSDLTDTSKYLIENDPSETLATKVANSGVLKKLRFHIYDQYSNSQSFSETVTANFVTSNEPVTVAELTPGLHLISFTMSTVGVYQLLVFTTINSISRLITGFSITINPGPGSAVMSTVTGVTSTGAGVLGTFTLVAKDSSGNTRTSGGDQVNVIIKNASNSVIPSNQVSVVDNSDGTYLIQYLLSQLGTYTVHITMNGDSTNELTQSISIVSGNPAPLQSSLTVPATIELGNTLSIFVQANDAYGNAVTSAVSLYGYLVLEANPNFLPLQLAFTTKSAATGLYTGSVKYDYKAADISGLCKATTVSPQCTFVGSLLVYVYVIYPGLEGLYFPTSTATGNPKIIAYNTVIGVDWVNKPIPGLTATALAIQWNGLLRSLTAGSYAFTLTATDSASLVLNKQTIVDTSTGVTQGTVTLAASSYYAITINFTCKSALPSLTLLWLPPAAAESAAIPETSLYHKDYVMIQGNPVPITGQT